MKYPKDENGLYVIDGEKFKVLTGTRAKVWHGTAYKTSGGLLKKDLLKNKHGDIVSKVKHQQESELSNLLKHGYGYKDDGTFGFERIKPITEKLSKSKLAARTKKNKEGATQQGGYHSDMGGVAHNAATFGGRRRKSRRHKGGNADIEFNPDKMLGGKGKKYSRSRRARSKSSMVAGGYSGTSHIFI